MTNYLPLVIFPVLYLIGKFLHRQPVIKPQNMDLRSGVEEAKADSYEESSPRNLWERFWVSENVRKFVCANAWDFPVLACMMSISAAFDCLQCYIYFREILGSSCSFSRRALRISSRHFLIKPHTAFQRSPYLFSALLCNHNITKPLNRR